jgi:hypothetical protein
MTSHISSATGDAAQDPIPVQPSGELSQVQRYQLVGRMLHAFDMGYRAATRGWKTVADLQLQHMKEGGVADAYRMGVEQGRADAACIEG